MKTSLFDVDKKAREQETAFAYSVVSPLFYNLAQALQRTADNGLLNTTYTVYLDLCARTVETHCVAFLAHDLDMGSVMAAEWQRAIDAGLEGLCDES